MAKVLFIIAQNDFRDEELLDAKAVLENSGYDCSVASITTKTATGFLGAVVKPDLAVKDAKIEDYAAVAVVGGAGAPELEKYPEVAKILKDAKAKGLLVCAICYSPAILAKIGLLKGKKATVWTSSTDKSHAKVLEQHGAAYSAQDVVQDGKIITACGPNASKKFGQAIANAIKGG